MIFEFHYVFIQLKILVPIPESIAFLILKNVEFFVIVMFELELTDDLFKN